jgi:hypothetical protein
MSIFSSRGSLVLTAVMILSSCAGLPRASAPEGYQLAVRNATESDLTVEYCAVSCGRLGQLKAAESRVFQVPAEAAAPPSEDRILVMGKVYFHGGYQQLALTPVYLRGRAPIEVVLSKDSRAATRSRSGRQPAR